MRFAIVGSGAVGGYYGARLVQAGHEVTFVARGAHLAAMRAHGLSVRSPLGDFVVPVHAEEHAADVPAVDVALFAVKAYGSAGALPILARVVGAGAVALTLQNGVDSVEEVAAVVGPDRTLGGSAYIGSVLVAPGVIEHTSTYRRIVFGEVFGDTSRISDRVLAIAAALAGADIQAEPVADARDSIWEKFCLLSPFAGCTGATRLPIGRIRSEPAARALLLAAFDEVRAVARAEGVRLPEALGDRIKTHTDAMPPAMKSSLLNDLEAGNPIEVEALLGSVVRRGTIRGVATPIMATLYAVLKPHEHGR